MMRNFGDHDVLRQMDRVQKIRYQLSHHYDVHNHHKLKEVMFLDLALEGYLRALGERIMNIDIGFEAYIREASIFLSSLTISYQYEELGSILADWQNIVVNCAKSMHEDNARKVKSVVDRVKALLGDVTDTYQEMLQTKAEILGTRFGLDKRAVDTFTEEVVRGTLFFSISMIVKKIEPHIRKCAHLGDWHIIS